MRGHARSGGRRGQRRAMCRHIATGVMRPDLRTLALGRSTTGGSVIEVEVLPELVTDATYDEKLCVFPTPKTCGKVAVFWVYSGEHCKHFYSPQPNCDMHGRIAGTRIGRTTLVCGKC